jgi:hypothetical protein
MGISRSTMGCCLRGKTSTSGGYQWRYADEPEFKNGITHLQEVKETRYCNAKIIVSYDLDGNIIKEYPSIGEACRKSGILRRLITLCVNGRQKTAGGFIWKYKKNHE